MLVRRLSGHACQAVRIQFLGFFLRVDAGWTICIKLLRFSKRELREGGACALPPAHPALPQRPFVFQMHDHVAFAADHRDGLVEDDGKRHEHETGKDIAGQSLA